MTVAKVTVSVHQTLVAMLSGVADERMAISAAGARLGDSAEDCLRTQAGS